ncbi:MAG: hypothetical protein JXX14_13685 [Deltaproteobacteria bacterium]|nr:hypothetical protein [Deltaproteobacteria bacterium]
MKSHRNKIPFMPVICTDCNVLALADMSGKPLCICCLLKAIGGLRMDEPFNITPLKMHIAAGQIQFQSM